MIWITETFNPLSDVLIVYVIKVGLHSDDEEFYDAEEETGSDFVITIPGKGHRFVLFYRKEIYHYWILPFCLLLYVSNVTFVL